MSEKNQKEPQSLWKFLGKSISEGWTESREKFGLAVDITLAVAAVGIVVFTWYSKHHNGFDEQIWEGRMNYWLALIPVGLWAIWFVYHVLKASHGIYIKQHKATELLLEKLKPKFKLSCHAGISGCSVTNHDGTWKFFRLLVETDCMDGIEKCLGHLDKIEKDGIVVFDHESRELPFAPSHTEDSLAKTIFASTPYFLDVLVIHSFQNTPNVVYIATKPAPSPSIDQKNRYIFLENGEYILYVSVSGKTAPTEPAKLKFTWTGNRHTSTIEKINE